MKLKPKAPEYKNSTPKTESSNPKNSINLTCAGKVPTTGTTIANIAKEYMKRQPPE